MYKTLEEKGEYGEKWMKVKQYDLDLNQLDQDKGQLGMEFTGSLKLQK